MDVEEFARFEKDLPGLLRAVILSAKIENPTRALFDAVVDNFQQGVIYEFFVGSKSANRTELENYENWFHRIFEVAKPIAPESGPNSEIHRKQASDLLKIRVLKLEWEKNVPYVFYYFRRDSSANTSVIAFRGDTPGSGISKRYSAVEPDEARSIIELCSAASEEFRSALPIQATIERAMPDGVVPFAKPRARE
ncbi:MAG: hypothetical protein WBO92_03710 [Candidatus Moraniibacteriota bacterium]